MADLKRRLEPLAERWALPEGSVRQLERFLKTLGSDLDAPTSVRDPVRGVDVHVADSLTGLEVPELREATRMVDIGSGAGLPGIVLAVALPAARLDLVEASARKGRFIERVVEELQLSNVRVVPARVEEWAAGEGAGAYDAAVVRAVGPLATLVEYAAPLLCLGGLLVAWKGRRDQEEERRGAAAAETLGMRPRDVRLVDPFAGSRNRHLYSYEKVAATPDGYPRRPGVARKRPLGGDGRASRRR
jgi:16S rRNA (guanine527-N7)-methyltransferase